MGVQLWIGKLKENWTSWEFVAWNFKDGFQFMDPPLDYSLCKVSCQRY